METFIDGDWVIYAAGFAGQKQELCYISPTGEGNTFPNVTAVKAFCEENGWPFNPEFLFKRIILDDPSHVLHSAKNMLNSVINKVANKFGHCTPQIFIDGDGNFRSRLATIRPYKGTRAPDSKPQYFNTIRQYLIDNWAAHVVFDQESDDELAIRQTQCTSKKSIIVAVDKDLIQVPGWHMNPNKGFKLITPLEGLQRLYAQAAEGDTVDNIAGCYKIGRKKARAIFQKLTNEQEMWDTLVGLYDESLDKFGEDLYNGLAGGEAALENMRLVYLRRKPEEIWLPPKER